MLRLLRHLLQFGLHGIPGFPEGTQFPDHPFRLLLGRQFLALGFQLPQLLLQLIQGHLNFRHPGLIFLHFRIGPGLLMVVKLFQPVFDFTNLIFQIFCLTLQGIQFRNFRFQTISLGFRLGKQATAVIAAAVLQIFQLFRQTVRRSAVITGGDQSVQAAAQRLVLGYRQVRMTNKAGPAEYRLLNTQKGRTTIGSRQFRYR